MLTNPGQIILQFQINHLLGEGYERSANVGTANNGFERGEVWPVDRDVFQQHDFVPCTLREPISNDGGNTEQCTEYFGGTVSARGLII